jgi:hypothetical protein
VAPHITNFMGYNLAIIIMRNLLFIGSYGIDMDVNQLVVLFEHQCLCALLGHKCHMFVRII